MRQAGCPISAADPGAPYLDSEMWASGKARPLLPLSPHHNSSRATQSPSPSAQDPPRRTYHRQVTTTLLHQSPSDLATPLLVVFATDTAPANTKDATPTLLTTNAALQTAATPWLTSADFKATLGETFLLPSPSGLKAQRLLLVGLGKTEKLTVHELRKAAGVAIRFARPRTLRTLAIALPEHPALPAAASARAIAEGAILADFDIDFYRADRKDLSIESLTVLSASTRHARTPNRLQRRPHLSRVARTSPAPSSTSPATSSPPPNSAGAPPPWRRSSASHCEVHSTDKLRELKMGAFLSVTQGSPEPPALILLRYEPATPPPPTLPSWA